MQPDRDSGKFLDAALAVFVFALLLFVSPLRNLWSAPGSTWYLPYLLWFDVIAAAWLVQRLRRRHGL